MVKHLFQSVKIEAVTDVLFVNFAEELMVLQVAEPADPSVAFLGAVGITV
jgi:hypothetical protein